MEIKDLKEGDILLFSSEHEGFISWAISFLTNAPVSHAAIFYNEKEQLIIEESPPQVTVNSAVERFKGREITVRRLKEDLPLHPVIEATTPYLNDEEPFDEVGLYMIGILLIYKKFTPSTMVQKVMVKILKNITISISKYINEQKYPNKLPMFCSQFVAQCYADAGDKYKLKIENGSLQKMSTNEANSNNVIDQVIQVIESGQRAKLPELFALNSKIQEGSSVSEEEVCKELKDALEVSTNKVATDITDELVEAVSQFAYAHYRSNLVQGQTHSTIQKDISVALQNLNSIKNIFVFPGDLLKHCNSLKDVGVIK